jgi:hypothetical protein
MQTDEDYHFGKPNRKVKPKFRCIITSLVTFSMFNNILSLTLLIVTTVLHFYLTFSVYRLTSLSIMKLEQFQENVTCNYPFYLPNRDSLPFSSDCISKTYVFRILEHECFGVQKITLETNHNMCLMLNTTIPKSETITG